MIRLIEEEFLKLKKTDNFILFKLKNITFENKENEVFTEELERELKLNSNDDFKIKAKEIKNLKSGDFISIKNSNETYSLVKLNSKPFLEKEIIKVEIDKSIDLKDELDIPTALRMDNRTKTTKLKKIETKELENFNIILDKILNKDENVYKENTDYFSGNSRQATSSIKGYLEQSMIGLFYLFFNTNYKKIDKIKIEGPLEDIEIKYRTGKVDYIQVKIAEKPENEKEFESFRFLEGLKGLELTYKKIKKYGIELDKLIYATNVYIHPVERITNLIKNGFIINDFTAFNKLVFDEKEKLQIKYKVITEELGDKLYFLRVDPKYLLENTEFLKEYDNLNSIIETVSEKCGIYESLKNKFLVNSAIREVEMSIYEIAYEFLRKSQNDRNFNSYYKLELEELDVDEIKELLEKKELVEKIRIYAREEYIIDKYLELEQKFNKNLVLSILKEFLDSNYIYLYEFELLSNSLETKEKELIYKYLLYIIFKSRTLIKNIRKEFCLE